MRKFLFFIFIIAAAMLITLSFHSCKYDNKEDLYPRKDTVSDCDTISVTYTSQIKSFFDDNCINCHNTGGQSPYFDNYTDAHNYAATPANKLNDYLLNNHQGISTSACQKAQMKKWISSGAY